MDEVTLYDRALSSSEIAAIYAAGAAGKCLPPHISAPPQSQVGYWGKSVTFNVTAQTQGTPTYQWFKETVPIGWATNQSLTLTNLQSTNAGSYQVSITDSRGTTLSAPAQLTINPAGVSIALYPGVTIEGVVGQTYGVQSNTDLSNTNSWVGRANITLTTPTQVWYDSIPASQLQSYYRVVPGPISIP